MAGSGEVPAYCELLSAPVGEELDVVLHGYRATLIQQTYEAMHLFANAEALLLGEDHA